LKFTWKWEISICESEPLCGDIEKFYTSLSRGRGINPDEQWFQKDGGTPHTPNDFLAWLRERFQEMLISRKCDVEWAPHLSDLNTLGFYLCGYRDNNE